MGREKSPLTDAQRAIVTALLKAGADGMTKDALEQVRSGARKTLRLMCKDLDWSKVLLMPGRTNGRYRIKGKAHQCPPLATEKVHL
jgi:hypothetical protein